MPTTQNALLGSTATTTALMAGLFYAYSCSVNPGLARLSDTAYLAAMQSINRAILNPVFFVVFLGTAFLLPLSAYLHYSLPPSLCFWLLLAATVVYIIGVMGVTMVGNVPLNETLDTFDLSSASVSEIAAQRAAFEGPWNTLHTVRTLSSVLAIMLVIAACLSSNVDQ